MELYGQPIKEPNTLGQNSLKWLGVSVITREGVVNNEGAKIEWTKR